VAYSTLTDLEALAGSVENVVELADRNGDGEADAEVIALAQQIADSWIDGFSARLYQSRLPWGGGDIDQVPLPVRTLAAQETLYQLRVFRRVNTELDDAERQRREATMAALEAGRWFPMGKDDPYPVNTGGGAPTVVLRSRATSLSDRVRGGDEDVTREDFEGFT
jgi:hypothetical protein